MSAMNLSLADMLLDTPDAVSVRPILEEDSFADIKREIGEIPEIPWPIAADAIAEAVVSTLDVEVIDILSAAWAKLDELQAYCDPERHPPGETTIVPLAEHRLRSTHTPSVEVMLGTKVIAKLTFYVELSLLLKGILLKIRDCRIWNVNSGSLAGQIILKFGSAVLMEK